MKLNIDQDQAIMMFLMCLTIIAFLVGVVAGIVLSYIYYEHWILNNFYPREYPGNPYYTQKEETQVFDNPIGPNGK